ncbi:hypothetical protein Tco_0649441 [Tanacetum coccineum]
MSDSEDSTVTYTTVSSPFKDGSDIGSPGVDGPPIMLEDPCAYIMAAYQVPPSPNYIPGPKVPSSPDYIPGPEEPQSPPLLDFVPEPMYPKYIPQEDEILSAEEQTLPAAVLPTTNSPGYVSKSDLEEELEEDNKDLEEDPADYLNDRDDDDDDDDDEDKDEEEVEEHPAPADSVPPVHRMTARISIRDEPSISLPPREEVKRILALTTLPPSPLTPLSSPLPHIPSPPFPASPPASPIRPTGRPEITLPPQKRLGIDLGPRYEIRESSATATTRPIGGHRADYGFVDPDILECWDIGFPRGMGMLHKEMLQADYQRQVQLTKALELLKGLQTQMAKFQRHLRPAKSLLSIMGYSQLADCIDLLFCLATQYRSFV